MTTESRAYASTVRLPYGKAADGRLVHISEVASGLACCCVCPKCKRQLVARKGPRNSHHFSHRTETASCEKAYETMLHLLAKQVIAERKTVWMPDGSYEHRSKRYSAFRSMPFRATSVSLELWMDGMRPDIVVRNDNRSKELLVEIFVTHSCEPQKVALIRERRIASIEIDLSKLSRRGPKEEFENAILSSAPRTWLFNPRIEQALEEWRARDEREAKQKQERENQRIKREASRLVVVLREARGKKIDQASDESKRPMAEVFDAGLSEFVGIASADSDCFTVTSSIWQAAVIHKFIIRDSWTRHFSLRDVRDFLRDLGFLLPGFGGRIAPEITEEIRASEPEFRPPWDTVHLYLLALRSHRLIDYNDDGDGNAYRISEVTNRARSRVSATQEHRRRIGSIRTKLDGLLARLPNGSNVDADQWMMSVQIGHSKSPVELTQSYSDYYQLIEHLYRLEKMLSTGPNVEENLLGLPMEEYLTARKEDRRRANEERQRLEAEETQRAAEAVRRAALHRKDQLAYETIWELGAEQGKLWLASPLSSLGGENVENRSGLSDEEYQAARSVLRREAVLQRRERKRRDCIEAILNEATALRGVEWTNLWMKQASPFLGGRKPIEVCVDEPGLEECRSALKRINHRPRHR